MTDTKPAAAPSGILSGFCGVAAHERCRGTYGGYDCVCDCHSEPPEPEPVGPHWGLRIGSLFSGYGGLERGVNAVLGGTVAWHSEIDPGACKILAHRFPDVPNLGDITTVDWSAVEPVDVLTGGFPCQDVSCAGLRQGLRPDTRSGLWTQMAYAIDQLRPPLVVIENVRGLLSAPAHSDLEPCPWCLGDDGLVPLRALGAVLGDLADIGYDASWQGLRAADVGAPHGRFRVFVTAWPAAANARHDAAWAGCEPRHATGRRAEPAQHGRLAPHAGGEGWCSWTGRDVGPAERVQGHDELGRSTAPHTPRHGRHEGRPEPARLERRPDAAVRSGAAAADTDIAGLEGSEPASGRQLPAWCADPDAAGFGRRSQGRDDRLRAEGLVQVDWGQYGDAVRRWERSLGRPAPAPTELSAKGSPRLSPRFVEWMQGLPAGWVTDVPGLSRNEQLKALGNGVVPQQAAQALRLLLPDVEAQVAAA